MKKEFLQNNKMNLACTIIMNLAQVAFSIYVAFILKDLVDIATGSDITLVHSFLAEVVIFLMGYVAIWVLEFVFKNRYIKTCMVNYRSYGFDLLFSIRCLTQSGS